MITAVNVIIGFGIICAPLEIKFFKENKNKQETYNRITKEREYLWPM